VSGDYELVTGLGSLGLCQGTSSDVPQAPRVIPSRLQPATPQLIGMAFQAPPSTLIGTQSLRLASQRFPLLSHLDGSHFRQSRRLRWLEVQIQRLFQVS
jgi:hypothetical protein